MSANDVDVVTLTQEWDSLAVLEAYIRSADFRVVLAAIDRSSRPPEIRVDHVSESQGFDYLKHVLSSHE